MGLFSIASKPNLAMKDLWHAGPKYLFFYKPQKSGIYKSDRIKDKHIKQIENAIKKAKVYLRSLGYKIIDNSSEADLKIRIYCSWKEPEINVGIASTDTIIKSSNIIINVNKLQQWWFIGERARYSTILHELGHAFGLVSTGTESAEKAGSRSTLNHCRNFNCAMTHRRLSNYFRIILAIIFKNKGKIKFCSDCENFLKGKLKKAK